MRITFDDSESEKKTPSQSHIVLTSDPEIHFTFSEIDLSEEHVEEKLVELFRKMNAEQREEFLRQARKLTVQERKKPVVPASAEQFDILKAIESASRITPDEKLSSIVEEIVKK